MAVKKVSKHNSLSNIKAQREILQRTIAEGVLPSTINEWQYQELSAVLSVEYMYASGTLTDAGYSESAMYGYVMALQHVREILGTMSSNITE